MKFLLLPCHFWHSCKDCWYSFFQRDQNSLAMCWIRRQYFLLYISGLENSPSGGETTFHFMVRIFTGDKGCRLAGSLRTSTIRGLEFKMCSTSVITVNKDSSSRHSPCVFLPNSTHMTCQRRVLMPSNPVTSPPYSSRKDQSFLSSISIYAFFNSCSAPMKLLPLSE